MWTSVAVTVGCVHPCVCRIIRPQQQQRVAGLLLSAVLRRRCCWAPCCAAVDLYITADEGTLSIDTHSFSYTYKSDTASAVGLHAVCLL